MIKLALLGKNIQHSKSKFVYEKLLQTAVDYQLLDCVDALAVPSLETIFSSNLAGLSITSPFKPLFLKEVELPTEIVPLQAINCVKFEKNKFWATNTDYYALIEILDSLFKKYSFMDVVILGDGAMSLVSQKILADKKIKFNLYSRSQNGDISNLDLKENHPAKTLIINTCLKEYLFSGSFPANSLFWDYNYDNEKQREKFKNSSNTNHTFYLDGHDLLERQAKLALSFWKYRTNFIVYSDTLKTIKFFRIKPKRKLYQRRKRIMFRKEFATIISKTGMIPLKDLRPLLLEDATNVIGEFSLLNFNFFDDVKFAKQLAVEFELPYIELKKAKVAKNILESITKTNVIKFRAIAVQRSIKAVSIAIYDPSIINLHKELQTLLQAPVEFILTDITSWKRLFEKLQISVDEIVQTIKLVTNDYDSDEKTIKEEDIGEDVISYVNRIFADSYLKKASDIHFEPYEKRFRVRYRIDGSLVEIDPPPKIMMLPVLSRLKIMAQLDIAERRKPQDGRIKMLINGNSIDYRVSSLPTIFGEKIVMRILDSSNLEVDMTKLGFEEKQLMIFKEAINRPYGMCLVTGPTGSGKTTTLYSAVAELNKIDTNISTAEDPVEFNLEGINQVNVRNDIGLTFASALKSFLRQDPDVILVGEIRDLDAGEIAIEAALTGHLVLSTLHTNDAPSTITRLLNMGIEPFLVTGSLNVVVAQRLCRTICKHCKIEDNISVEELVNCGFSRGTAEKLKVYKGTGCDACSGTGYKGRVAIFEVMPVTPSIRDLIIKGSSADELKRQAIKDGMKTLRMAALTKVARGETTIYEATINSTSDKI